MSFTVTAKIVERGVPRVESSGGWHSKTAHCLWNNRNFLMRRDILWGTGIGFGLLLSSGTGKAALEKIRDEKNPVADYDHYAESYDELDDGVLASGLGLDELRQSLISNAKGDVLEVGIGTGINLQFYDFARIDSVTGLDLSLMMIQQAKLKINPMGASNKVKFVTGNVESLPYEDRTFDTIIDTFGLCVYSDPVKAISEMKRVLKDDGVLLLLEHSRSGNPILGAYQDATADSVKAMGKGCVWNQNVDSMIESNGLQVVKSERHLAGLISSYMVAIH